MKSSEIAVFTRSSLMKAFARDDHKKFVVKQLESLSCSKVKTSVISMLVMHVTDLTHLTPPPSPGDHCKVTCNISLLKCKVMELSFC